ncbi:hypothetical protein [Roseateles asaccharophilus]|uniref:hypothetical protein n=1 Tax=Roseateles asaccharophilus TaxID=582607 RepID=UPI00384F8A3F
MTRVKTEAITPPEVFEQLVKVAGDDVLIGGQALAVWVEHYGIEVPENVPAISRDVDFLTRSPTEKGSLKRYAKALIGEVHVYDGARITALVGQAFREVANDEVLNVDVLWTVIGLDPESVRANAVTATRGEVSFRVMHPMDVLRSRLANLYKLPEKATPVGVMQLDLGVQVVRAHLRSLASQSAPEDLGAGRSPLQPMVSMIEKLALEDSGRKIAKRYGVYVADAIDPNVIPPGPFWEKKWPQLKELMSPDYAATITPAAPTKVTGDAPATTADRPAKKFSRG